MALVIAVAVAALELVVGWWADSVALLADAAHMAGDSLGLLIALVAMVVAGRRPAADARRSFGLHRAEVLAAGLNGLVLLCLCGWIGWHAIARLAEHFDVEHCTLQLEPPGHAASEPHVHH